LASANDQAPCDGRAFRSAIVNISAAVVGSTPRRAR